MDYIFQSANPRIKPVYFAAAVVIAVLAGAVMEYWRTQKKSTKTQTIAVVLLSAYIFLVFASTVFSREQRGYYSYKLVPFWSYQEMLEGSWELFWENILNVVMLLPIGVLLPMAMAGNKNKEGKIFSKVILTAFLASLAIECLQLFLKCGLFEFDDMFHNTIGAAIGYWGYRKVRNLSRKILVEKTRKIST